MTRILICMTTRIVNTHTNIIRLETDTIGSWHFVTLMWSWHFSCRLNEHVLKLTDPDVSALSLPFSRQILQNIFPCSYFSHGHCISHCLWYFRSGGFEGGVGAFVSLGLSVSLSTFSVSLLSVWLRLSFSCVDLCKQNAANVLWIFVFFASDAILSTKSKTFSYLWNDYIPRNTRKRCKTTVKLSRTCIADEWTHEVTKEKHRPIRNQYFRFVYTPRVRTQKSFRPLQVL